MQRAPAGILHDDIPFIRARRGPKLGERCQNLDDVRVVNKAPCFRLPFKSLNNLGVAAEKAHHQAV